MKKWLKQPWHKNSNAIEVTFDEDFSKVCVFHRSGTDSSFADGIDRVLSGDESSSGEDGCTFEFVPLCTVKPGYLGRELKSTSGLQQLRDHDGHGGQCDGSAEVSDGHNGVEGLHGGDGNYRGRTGPSPGNILITPGGSSWASHRKIAPIRKPEPKPKKKRTYRRKKENRDATW